MIVLDTHAAILYAADLKLKRAAGTAIEESVAGSSIAISAISAWAIGMLVLKNRLQLPQPNQDYVRALFALDGVVEEPITAEIARLAAVLPDFHADLADRMIVATAIARTASLITRDDSIIRYLRRTKATAVIPS